MPPAKLASTLTPCQSMEFDLIKSQDDKRLLTGLQQLQSLQKKPESEPSPAFQPPSSLTAYKLALQYRLCRKQSLERALINVRSRLKGK